MDFKPIELADRARIESVTLPLRRNDSALGFVNLYSLQEKYGIRFCIQDETLFLRVENRVPGEVAYYPPIGKCDLNVGMDVLITEGRASGRPFRFVGVTPQEKCALADKYGDAFEFVEDRDFAEYIYLTERLATYSGRDLAKKRREVRKFYRLYGNAVSVDDITPEILEETLRFQKDWFDSNRYRTSEEHPLESENRKIIDDAEHFWELALEGIVLRVDGKIQGYSYGFMLPGGAFDVLVLKGNLEYQFIWRVILQEMAKRYMDRAQFMNLEEDIGLPGLREMKLGFRPFELMEKYQAIPR